MFFCPKTLVEFHKPVWSSCGFQTADSQCSIRISRLFMSKQVSLLRAHTSGFVDDARAPVVSPPYIKPFDMLLTCCKLPAVAIPSPGVWVDGVDGWELEGPTVFPVPVLLAGPEDEGPFLFRLFYYTINKHWSVIYQYYYALHI